MCIRDSAGAFGEHRFGRVIWDRRLSGYPGGSGDYAAEPLTSGGDSRDLDDTHLAVDLPPATRITLELETRRHVNPPSAVLPWPG